jgi:RimJ/RimL family protein N-acetyltransferase
MPTYSCLNQQVFSAGEYKIVPIRFEDRLLIRKWRNEQIYHLRQNKVLSIEDQEYYFSEVVAPLFEQERPGQLLFSFLKDNKCIGYGGLVHINWTDQHAELSFIMATALEKEYFEFYWSTYLALIEQVAFKELELHKIFTYAYDLRPRLYASLSQMGFEKEATLKEHASFEGEYVDVVIHSKLNALITLRKARLDDLEITFSWANNKAIRAFAYNQNPISIQDHTNWFENKIISGHCVYLILEIDGEAAGSIRFDIAADSSSAKISYLIDPKFTGNGYGTYLLEKGIAQLLILRSDIQSVVGFVMKENLSSIKIFKKLAYEVTFESETELKFEKKLK